MTWKQIAKFCEETFGIFVNWGECDFSMCPICETDFELI